jgi:hypothetical protein
MKPDLHKIESYLFTLGVHFEQVSDDVWLIQDNDKGLSNLIVFVDENLVTLRARLFNVSHLSDNKKLEFYTLLLKYNLEMIHGAYALEDDSIVVMDTLELVTMDFEEFQASIDALGLAIAQHYHVLSQYSQSAKNS